MVSVNIALVGFTGPLAGLIRIVKELEELGVDSVSIPDDLYLVDPFIGVANLALNTDRITLSLITNPYSRHPVLIARGVATLMSMAPNRITLSLCAGGSFTLKPLNIPMWEKPVAHVREALQICRILLSGEKLDFSGKIFSVHDVKLQFPFHHEPPKMFLAGRGIQILSLAGELGDGATIDPISPAYEKMIIKEIYDAARRNNRDPSKLVLGTSITLTRLPPEEFQRKAARRIANVVHDTPLSTLKTFRENVTPEIVETLIKIHDAPSVEAAVPLVTEEIANLYPNTVNSPEKLIELLKGRVKNGYKAVGIVATPGEEFALVKSLDKTLIQEIHAIN